ncbi:hypothetical protein TC41_1399 [Alicyclobacillus acidocaldarius subsp. acidocaldarius Tc-4-1]|uniref:Uncharacterized protein n=1 Tax=Alicyclobacillus acidocaldarius (strain Tc-4-1) TaxID=1048834 RepID=F8IIK3_ALIAT|nr:hypothetical protein TC41_1399 [Alicyclobacillus acidocaldarius subsp. acidocaldarius Tc-4-1]
MPHLWNSATRSRPARPVSFRTSLNMQKKPAQTKAVSFCASNALKRTTRPVPSAFTPFVVSAPGFARPSRE